MFKIDSWPVTAEVQDDGEPQRFHQDADGGLVVIARSELDRMMEHVAKIEGHRKRALEALCGWDGEG